MPHPADHFTTTWRVYVSAAVLKLEKLLQKLYLIGGLLLLLITITVNFRIERKLHYRLELFMFTYLSMTEDAGWRWTEL